MATFTKNHSIKDAYGLGRQALAPTLAKCLHQAPPLPNNFQVSLVSSVKEYRLHIVILRKLEIVIIGTIVNAFSKIWEQ